MKRALLLLFCIFSLCPAMRLEMGDSFTITNIKELSEQTKAIVADASKSMQMPFGIAAYSASFKDENVSGAYEPKTRTIYINEEKSPNNDCLIYTCYHEMGHAKDYLQRACFSHLGNAVIAACNMRCSSLGLCSPNTAEMKEIMADYYACKALIAHNNFISIATKLAQLKQLEVCAGSLHNHNSRRELDAIKKLLKHEGYTVWIDDSGIHDEPRKSLTIEITKDLRIKGNIALYTRMASVTLSWHKMEDSE